MLQANRLASIIEILRYSVLSQKLKKREKNLKKRFFAKEKNMKSPNEAEKNAAPREGCSERRLQRKHAAPREAAPKARCSESTLQRASLLSLT